MSVKKEKIIKWILTMEFKKITGATKLQQQNLLKFKKYSWNIEN